MSDNFSPQNPQPAPPGGGSNPRVNDPTTLTTEQLTRQITNLKELLVEKIDGTITRVTANKELCEIKFEAIATQLDGVEDWRKEQKTDTKTAVDAALQAAKDAVREQTAASEKAIAKSETSFADQLKQQNLTFGESRKAIETSVSDLKERILRLETLKDGAMDASIEARNKRTETRNESSAVQYVVFGVIGISLIVVVAVINIVIALPR